MAAQSVQLLSLLNKAKKTKYLKLFLLVKTGHMC